MNNACDPDNNDGSTDSLPLLSSSWLEIGIFLSWWHSSWKSNSSHLESAVSFSQCLLSNEFQAQIFLSGDGKSVSDYLDCHISKKISASALEVLPYSVKLMVGIFHLCMERPVLLLHLKARQLLLHAFPTRIIPATFGVFLGPVRTAGSPLWHTMSGIP